MAGLIGLAFLAVLLIALLMGATKLADLLPIPVGAKIALTFLMAIGFFPLVFIDEIIGKYQFKALCKNNGIEGVDVSKIRNKTVDRKSGPRNYISGQIIPIKVSNEILLDAGASRVLLEYNDYFAEGGWLVRHTPIGLGDTGPLIFNGNGCGFDFEENIFHQNHVTQAN